MKKTTDFMCNFMDFASLMNIFKAYKNSKSYVIK